MKSCIYKHICINRRKMINYEENGKICTRELYCEYDTCSKCHDQCNFELDHFRFGILDMYYQNHPHYEEMVRFGTEYLNKNKEVNNAHN